LAQSAALKSADQAELFGGLDRGVELAEEVGIQLRREGVGQWAVLELGLQDHRRIAGLLGDQVDEGVVVGLGGGPGQRAVPP
jgi:hypothetical protein